MDPVEEDVIKRKNFGTPLKHDPTFAGPLTKRSCTDIICLLIFIAFIAGWVVVAALAYKEGDPQRLIYPTDSLGQRCGIDEKVKNKPYLFFFDMVRCASPGVLTSGCATPQVCVETCPTEDFAVTYYLAGSKSNSNLQALRRQLICRYDVDKSQITWNNIKSHIDDNKCAAWYIRSQILAGRCIPVVIADTSERMLTLIINGADYKDNQIDKYMIYNATENLAKLASKEEIGEKLLQDLVATWHIILIGLGVSALICIIYIIIMRWIAAPMVWISLFGSIIALSYAIYACYERFRSTPSYKDSPLPTPTITDVFTGNLDSFQSIRETWLALMIISIILLIVVLLITIALRNRLRIAIALIREASKAVGSTMSTLFFPILPWILQLAVLAFGISVMLYLASTGEAEYRISGNMTSCSCPSDFKVGYVCQLQEFDRVCNPCNTAACAFYQYKTPTRTTWLHIYNLFGLFWGLFFVSAFGEMVLAGTFATWYWTFRKVDVPYFTLTSSILRTMRYHLGTLAFGSLIIAICRMIRVFLEWLDQKLKKYDNQCVKAILCCCKCCFWCLEKFLRFLNRNAYIMCAVHGKNFCTSARDAFFLLMRNVVRVVVLDKVTDFLLFLGKLLVVTGMVVLAYFTFTAKISFIQIPEMNYYMAPVILIGIGTYLIASVFFGVYAIAVDTLFLCFLEDSERNDGSAEKPYFMSSKLMRILNKKNKTE